ncbi:MAG: L-seryl-tRNA(Sec) selenium transferase [Deltaproteobacteria bacterium]|nr:L-seryl-tRNA(Sec) selenium transferase [Deltaproteobacteria bacterium]
MADEKKNQTLRDLPSVNEVLRHPDVLKLIDENGREPVKLSVRDAIDNARRAALENGQTPKIDAVASHVTRLVSERIGGTLKPVVNATGVVLHTNLGRAPLGKTVIEEISRIAGGYSSLELDLRVGRRGHRKAHVKESLRLLTGADDVIVVNNNAAGIILSLSTLAKDKEVVVSRGELIEIGGSFRIPDIMSASGARMVEVGTTNRTRLSDYEEVIGPDTALLFKAHTSNYAIKGFTEDVPVADLARLAHDHDIPMMYDIGSGLLRRPRNLPLENEPDVKEAIAAGADIVAFSGDKLLGGPQAGILAGSEKIIPRLGRAPLMRALRVCKTTYAALSAVCRDYFRDESLIASNPTFAMLERSPETLHRLAGKLRGELENLGVEANVVESSGQCGGGTLPDLRIPSAAVEIVPIDGIAHGKQTFAEALFKRLLEGDRPVLGVLREGRILFDVLAVFEEDIPYLAKTISKALDTGEQQ